MVIAEMETLLRARLGLNLSLSVCVWQAPTGMSEPSGAGDKPPSPVPTPTLTPKADAKQLEAKVAPFRSVSFFKF
jgi:hypothetical protein